MDKLVNYSSSSSEDEQLPIKKIKLPVPFKVSVESDNNNKSNENYGVHDAAKHHQGRKRQIPHIEGNWSCHVFIDCPQLKENLSDYLNAVTEKYKGIEIVELPHVSLSKNFIIKYHWIDNLSKVLVQNLKFNTFNVKFEPSHIKFLSNEDNSRHFACILVDESCESDLEKLIESTDKSLQEFDLPTYYKNRIFHASIFWKLKEFSVEEKTFIKEEIHNFVLNDDISILCTFVEKVTFKTGNKIKFINCQ